MNIEASKMPVNRRVAVLGRALLLQDRMGTGCQVQFHAPHQFREVGRGSEEPEGRDQILKPGIRTNLIKQRVDIQQ
jgi:hypothetical protein